MRPYGFRNCPAGSSRHPLPEQAGDELAQGVADAGGQAADAEDMNGAQRKFTQGNLVVRQHCNDG